MNQSNLKFKLRSIDILEFSLKSTDKEINQNTVFRFDTRLEQFTDPANKFITVVSSFSIYCDAANCNLGEAKISITYQLEDVNVVETDEALDLPEQFILMLNSISLSTCRGVLFTLFRGTPLHSVILPIINPNNLKELEHSKIQKPTN